MSSFAPQLSILPHPQRVLWDKLSETPRQFVLYGGTAMALRLGHRQSEDFDFFSNEAFEAARLLTEIGYLRSARIDQRDHNTLTVTLDFEGPVKVSFFGDLGMSRVCDPDVVDASGLQVASLLDVTATKLKTIQQRAEVKDYRDIVAALEHGIKLPQALAAAQAIYGPRFNGLLTLKALTYFGDGNLNQLSEVERRKLRQSATTPDLKHLPVVEVRAGISIRDS